MLSLQWPWLLLALPLPWLISRWMPASVRGGAIRLPSHLSGFVQSGDSPRQKPWLAMLAWIALLLAASRPIWLGEPISLPATGRDIVLAVDLSGSMDEQDIEYRGRAVQRLAVVKAVAGEFIERRKGDRLGLVLFGDQAYLQSPLSLDRKTTRQLLDEAEVGLAGQKTAIGDAIGLSIKHLLAAGVNDEKVVVLLTDGENNAGRLSPDKSAELAAQSNIRVHTIGFSGAQTVRLGPFVQTRKSPIDSTTLEAVAKKTGGRFFAAQSIAELEQIYALLDEIEPVQVDELSFRPRTELHYWPLSIALLLSLLHLLTSSGWLHSRKTA